MKIKILQCVIFWLCSINAYAVNLVDLYGIQDERVEKILREHSKQVAAVEQKIIQEVIDENAGKGDEKKFNAIVQERMQLINKIKQQNKLLSVDFQTISYPDKQLACTTIEVVSQDQPERLKYINYPMASAKKSGPKDVIDSMNEYSTKAITLLLNNKLSSHEAARCPYYYCGFGFDNPDLKPYYPLFKKAAIEQRQLILDTLNSDSDVERRAAAAFLVGYFSHPQEIIKLLLPHVNDPNNGVRNNVILVIGGVMQAAHISDINLKPFVSLLNSPYTTDRNKSLIVLMEAVKSKKSQRYLQQHALDKLIALLKLKQLNNHDPAYALLKTLSGKDFGDKNISAWEKWRKEVV